jgi:hypothetical protein
VAGARFDYGTPQDQAPADGRQCCHQGYVREVVSNPVPAGPAAPARVGRRPDLESIAIPLVESPPLRARLASHPGGDVVMLG